MCHHGLIQLIVSHQLSQQGIPWADFISHEVFTAPPQPQLEPEAIHEEGGPSHQPEIIVPRHVVSPPHLTYQRGHRTLFAAARRVFSPQQVEGVSSSSSDQRVLSPHQVEGASLPTAAQVAERGKQPMIEERVSGAPVIDLDAGSPSTELKDIIREQSTEIHSLQTKLLMEKWIINYLEQRNKQLEDEHKLYDLQKLREDRELARRRPGDLRPIDRESMLIWDNAHLKRMLAKAKKDNKLLRNMKNHYWAQMHVCKEKMKVLQMWLAKALKRRKRPDPLSILVEASLKEHSTK